MEWKDLVYPLGIIGHGHVTVLPLRETLLHRDAKEKVKCSRCTVLRACARWSDTGYSTITVSIILDTAW